MLEKILKVSNPMVRIGGEGTYFLFLAWKVGICNFLKPLHWCCIVNFSVLCENNVKHIKKLQFIVARNARFWSCSIHSLEAERE